MLFERLTQNLVESGFAFDSVWIIHLTYHSVLYWVVRPRLFFFLFAFLEIISCDGHSGLFTLKWPYRRRIRYSSRCRIQLVLFLETVST